MGGFLSTNPFTKLGETLKTALNSDEFKQQKQAYDEQRAASIADNTPPSIGATLRGIEDTRQEVLGAGQGVRNTTGAQANNLMSQAGQSIFSAPSITKAPATGLLAGFNPTLPIRSAGAAPAPAASGNGPHIVQPTTSVGGTIQTVPNINQLIASGGYQSGGTSNGYQQLPASLLNNRPNLMARQEPAPFQVGQQLARPQLSAPPATIANRLGAAPAQQTAMSIAERLGAAPTVGSVNDVQMGAAPGDVAGRLGNMGQANAGQQNFLSRIEGFLDAPEGPSVAEAQLRQAQADNMGNLLGAARSGRGGAGAQAQALRGAISEGAALSSDTAGQMATLRAQEQDMRQGRNLQAMGLGSDLSTAQRAGDLSFRGQDLSALQGDQSTSLGARGQDLSAAQGNQSTQLGLQQLSAQTALGARGQDLSALQGDQGAYTQMAGINAQTALGARGQDLGALQSDQSTSLGARGQDLEGNIAYRGQDVQTRDQDRQALTDDANRSVATNELNLRRELGLTDLGLQAQGQGLAYDQAMQGYGLGALGMATDYNNNEHNRAVQLSLGNQAIDSQMQMQRNEINSRPSYWEQLGLSLAGNVPQGAGMALGGYLGSDERAKTDISPLDKLEAFADSPANELVRKSPGYSYRYTDGASRSLGEDPSVEHWGPMAQDLEKSKIGRSLVRQGKDGIKRVDVGRLALTDHAALHTMRRELDTVREILGPLSRFLQDGAA